MTLDLNQARYDGYDFEKLKGFFIQHYDMNSLLKKISVESRPTSKTDFQYEVVQKMPPIQEDSSVFRGYL